MEENFDLKARPGAILANGNRELVLDSFEDVLQKLEETEQGWVRFTGYTDFTKVGKRAVQQLAIRQGAILQVDEASDEWLEACELERQRRRHDPDPPQPRTIIEAFGFGQSRPPDET